jgi:hypothetical protein
MEAQSRCVIRCPISFQLGIAARQGKAGSDQVSSALRVEEIVQRLLKFIGHWLEADRLRRLAEVFGLKKPEKILVYSSTNSYCQTARAGIYSVPSLAPLTTKVSQVEMEADDCEGRLPPLFFAWS